MGVTDATIDYEYDALNRLIIAVYSNPNNPGAPATAFDFTYDAMGNVLEYTATINGQTVTTTYEYNAANQLISAQKSGGTRWLYTYDGNGSLIQSSPEGGLAGGAKRYSYNTAGYLTKVEVFENGWQNQADMAYDGLGRRLEMTGYAEGQSVTTRYTIDGNQTLVADAAGNQTMNLYGAGLIAEYTDAWSFPIVDGTNTPRQLVNGNGEVTLAVSYTPWGDTLAIVGTGGFSYGYFGGVMDAATGLIYVGNGQYYDPSTGRFLTPNVRPDQSNPYVPWRADASSLAIAPLVLLSLIYSRKRGKRTRWDSLFIFLVIVTSVSVGLTACGSGIPISNHTGTSISTSTPTPPSTMTSTTMATPTTEIATLPASTSTPVITLTLDCTGNPCDSLGGEDIPLCRQKRNWEMRGVHFAGVGWTYYNLENIEVGLNKILFTIGSEELMRRDLGMDQEGGLTIMGISSSAPCRGQDKCYDPRTNTINLQLTVYTDNIIMQYSLIHEAGHALDYQAGKRMGYGAYYSYVHHPSEWKLDETGQWMYSGIVKPGQGIVSSYAKKSVLEDFAETFVYKVNESQGLFPPYDGVHNFFITEWDPIYGYGAPSLERENILNAAIYQ
jgi:RHS repeat-associated protein